MIGAIVLAALIGTAFGSMALVISLALGVPGWLALIIVGAGCVVAMLVGLAVR